MIECQRSQDFENFYILITCSTFITDHMYFLPECFLNIKLGKAWNIRVVETIRLCAKGYIFNFIAMYRYRPMIGFANMGKSLSVSVIGIGYRYRPIQNAISAALPIYS